MDAAGQDDPSRLHRPAVGQVAEWLVWTRLVATSGGDLHVFLPLDDRGIDGIVHRISTDEYARVQVKGRAVLHQPGLPIQVSADEVADDLATVVAVRVDLEAVQLGPRALVCPAPVFRRLGHYDARPGRTTYDATVVLSPDVAGPWAEWCVAVDDMGQRLLPAGVGERPLSRPLSPTSAADTAARKRRGYRAEMELIHKAAPYDRLNIFKAFPDLEANEYLLYDIESRRIAGIQVKAVTVPEGSTEARVTVHRPAFRPSPHTWFAVFIRAAGERDFLPDCLLLPSQVVEDSLTGHGDAGMMVVTRHAGGHLSPWRVALADLGAALANLTAAPHDGGHS